MIELKITPWEIVADTAEDKAYRESIFSQGNGYMGTRGYRLDERGEHPAWRSTFLSGFYEYVRPGVTDIVNQPDFSAMEIRLDGQDSNNFSVSDFKQTLCMKNGLLTWDYCLHDDMGKRTHIKMDKFLSMDNKHLAIMRVQITPENWSGFAEVSGGIDGTVQNLPISDDQLSENIEFAAMWGEEKTEPLSAGGLLTAWTKVSHREIAEAYELFGEGQEITELQEKQINTKLKKELCKGETWVIQKNVAVASFRDGNAQQIACQSLHEIASQTFEKLLENSSVAWDKIWENADVCIEGNDEWQGAIRYNIYQLIQATPRDDPRASIGARGLTHGRYKGCYFWDTEIFMLPMFCWNQPEVAKNLLLYRFNTLPDAVESAKQFSATGARYPWMASDTGFEQCGTWDTGCCEIHITADIALAIGQYCEITGDKAFLEQYGAEILLQTARYWVDRFNYNAKEDCYHLLFVKGPDEYCGVTVDDFYTVSVAKKNLELAIQTARELESGSPEIWSELCKKIDLRAEEVSKWQDMAGKMIREQDAQTKLWKQDATFDMLTPLDVQMHKEDDVPLYHKIGFDRLQRYQVLKQPAVLMYMASCPEEFSQEELLAAWDYYEPKTLHDSTLSFGIHALLAARLHLKEKAVRYFEKSAFLDLKNVMKNTANEGIHTASLGATWQAVVLGFGGLHIRDGQLAVENRLPDEIKSMRSRIFYGGKRYQITIDKIEGISVISV